MNEMPVINMAKTGKNIVRLRTLRGLSVKDMQDLFGFATPQAIYKWQYGKALPSIDNLIVLSVILGVRIDDILIIEADSIQISA